MEVVGRVVWGTGGVFEGRIGGGVFSLEQMNFRWSKVTNSVDGATLALCGEKLVYVGGYKDGVYSKKVMELRGGRWSLMSDMLVECGSSCVVSISGGGMVVMGGYGVRGRQLDDVQVFDGNTQTWRRGPALPQPCSHMSAVVHGHLVFVMGGANIDRTVWCADIHDLVSP